VGKLSKTLGVINMKTNQMLHVVAFFLVLVGALNWGLIGLFGLNLVQVLGLPAGLAQTVYVLIGASAVYIALTHKGDCKTCMEVMKKWK